MYIKDVEWRGGGKKVDKLKMFKRIVDKIISE